MILFDILIWAVLLLFVVKGFLKGFVREVCSLLGLVAGGWVAFKYYPFVAEAMKSFIHLPQQVAQILSFILIFLVIGVLFFFVGHLLTIIFKIMLLGGLNRVGGVFIGLLEGAFVLCMVLYLGTTKPVPDKVRSYILKSHTAQPLISAGKEIAAGWEGTIPQGKTSHRKN